jgi:hypothetical protein
MIELLITALIVYGINTVIHPKPNPHDYNRHPQERSTREYKSKSSERVARRKQKHDRKMERKKIKRRNESRDL